MPKTRQQKEEAVSELEQKLGRAKSAAFATISGFTMKDADELRLKASEQGAEVGVAKKNLLEIAARNSKVQGFDANALEGSILAVFGYEDEITPAKLIAGFAKKRDSAKIIAGIMNGEFIGKDAVIQLSKLPSKEELYAKVVGSLNAPVSGFVNVLRGNLRGLVCALQAIQNNKS
ncbi:MAG: hypothetical protein ACD_76C00152G0001 [uncultured bacterium]|nr:MAG: hypothetical protein ACD_76C00152G0001 [uncultured bacterium]HBD04875.1 50S ribosomal protein L10 [Candidatus Uhrbacteria bacterium]